jgi:hypothetical protein
VASADEPIDESELDIREMVPRVGKTAETDKLTALVRGRWMGGDVREESLEVSDEDEPMVAVCGFCVLQLCFLVGGWKESYESSGGSVLCESGIGHGVGVLIIVSNDGMDLAKKLGESELAYEYT